MKFIKFHLNQKRWGEGGSRVRKKTNFKNKPQIKLQSDHLKCKTTHLLPIATRKKEQRGKTNPIYILCIDIYIYII